MAAEPNNERIVREAAKAYNIPYWVLWGVYGKETGHGADVKTSSGGAKGSFQFLNTTAAEYHYPWNNETNEQVFTEQALAAAHYLSVLYKQTGNWNSALHSYSGGGYGQAEVEKEGGYKEKSKGKESFLEKLGHYAEGPLGPA